MFKWIKKLFKPKKPIPKPKKKKVKTTYSITKNGKPLDPKLYTLNVVTKIFSSREDGLVLNFKKEQGWYFDTYSNCKFKTGSYCSFDVEDDCIIETDFDCNISTGSRCIIKTKDCCMLKTGNDCKFDIGNNCTTLNWFDDMTKEK